MADELQSSDIYTPLITSRKEIRLLILDPAPALDSAINIRLQTASLLDHPRYEAISYAWGDPRNTTEVLLSRKPFPLTVSLAGALRRFRHVDQPRVLWADAACINQVNLAERSDQVSKMGDVYAGAVSVLVWLGEPANDTERVAAETIFRVATELGETGIATEQARSVICHWTWLMSRPWFHRLWVVQEVRLARKVFAAFAGYILPGERLSRLNKAYIDLGTDSMTHSSSPCHFAPSPAVYLPWDMECSGADSEKIFAAWNHMSVSDLRDRVYAVRRLVKLEDHIEVDYSKTYQQVMEDFARAICSKTWTLDVLDVCPSADTSWPSWVPGPGRPALRRKTVGRASAHVSYHTSSGCKDPPARLKVDCILHSCLQQITVLEPASRSSGAFGYNLATDGVPMHDREDYSVVQCWKETLKTSRVSFWRIVAGGAWGERPMTDSKSIVADRIYNTISRAEPPDVSSLQRRFGMSAVSRFVEVTAAMSKWLPCTTSNGLPGKVWRGSKEMDRIGILAGCAYPVVLRHAPEQGPRCYRVVGPAYIASIMDGEAVKNAFEATACTADIHKVRSGRHRAAALMREAEAGAGMTQEVTNVLRDAVEPMRSVFRPIYLV